MNEINIYRVFNQKKKTVKNIFSKFILIYISKYINNLLIDGVSSDLVSLYAIT